MNSKINRLSIIKKNNVEKISLFADKTKLIKPIKKEKEKRPLINESNKKKVSKKIGIKDNKNNQQKDDNDIMHIKELIFTLFNKDKIINLESLRKYIINLQKKSDSEYFSSTKHDSLNNKLNLNILISLISRYSIIIYYLLRRKKLNEAKNLFLLMIKENMKNIEIQTFRIFKSFNKLQQKYEIINVYPKAAIELFKIYSFLIKYSSLFNLSSYKNKFMSNYLSLHSLNYKIFKRKFEIRGFNVETRNSLKYWFAICLHYASYFSIKYYCPLRVPISLTGLIIKVYRNLDDIVASKNEKNLINNTLYNQSIFYYLNNQTENSLRNLRLMKQKIISYYNKENSINNISTKYPKLFDFNEKHNSFLYLLNQKTNSLESYVKKKMKEYSFNSPNDFIEQTFLNEGNRKENLKIEDIIDIFNFDFNEVENSEEPLKKSMTVKNNIKNQIESDKNNFKLLNIPNYLNEPLFINIELLMAEIDLNRKNFLMCYEHIKNCLILILISKKFENVSDTLYYRKILNFISKYLEEIEKNNINKKLVSKIKSLQSLSLILNKEEINNLKSTNNKENKQSNIFSIDDKNNINNEMEKLFIFLNSLSIYQIKLLNETQPPLNTRNELPIFFSNQFKDSLTIMQRQTLDKLNVISISRCALLIDPNLSIFPSNLKFTLNNRNKNNISKINQKSKSMQISPNRRLINGINSRVTENNIEKENEILDSDIIAQFENLRKIILSSNNKNKLKLYLINNIYYICKILTKSNTEQIDDMIKYPEILIHPIKNYKKKHKDKKRKKFIQEEIMKRLIQIPKFNILLKNHNSLSKEKNKDDKRITIHKAELNRVPSTSISYEINSISSESASS